MCSPLYTQPSLRAVGDSEAISSSIQSSRESGSPALPLTPPDMRVRIRRFGKRQDTDTALAL